MTVILDGKAKAEEMQAEVRISVSNMQENWGIVPGLAAVLVGDDPASTVYVRNKSRACARVGIYAETFNEASDITQAALIDRIGELNKDSRFHGILVQLPLPDHIDEGAVIETIDPKKDVDCLHPSNLGLLAQGRAEFIPATPGGIQQLLIRSGFSTEGKHVVVCGRSNIVGKPLALLLMQRGKGANSTVTVCHTGTEDLRSLVTQADILVAALGRPQFIKADMVKKGAVVIDVGINRVDDPSRPRGYRLVGDVDFDPVCDVVEAITPVPGGVGPMTVAMLLVNTVTAAEISLRTRS